MSNEDYKVIRCPICGQEYLPSEIFFPDDLIGHPTEIIKNTSGKIDFYLGSNQCLEETYTCDNCGTRFKVKANLSFFTEVMDKKFEEEYVSHIDLPKRISLEEDTLFDD